MHPSSDIINIFWLNLSIINCRYGIHWRALINIIIMVVSGRVARFSFTELETELTFPWKLPMNQKLEWLVKKGHRKKYFQSSAFFGGWNIATLWQEKGAVDPRGMFLRRKMAQSCHILRETKVEITRFTPYLLGYCHNIVRFWKILLCSMPNLAISSFGWSPFYILQKFENNSVLYLL